MKDFTLKAYKKLLQELLINGYSFQTLQDFIQHPEAKTVILRHDVDRLPENSLKMAKLEHELGIGSTYYFRAVPESWDEAIIKKIAEMGHEIGYHYENLSEMNCLAPQYDFPNLRGKQRRPSTILRSYGASKGAKKDRTQEREKSKEKLFELAIDDFRLNLEKFRKIYPVKTICMHGSPLSRWDNRDLWKKYNYRDFGIIGEPYFDVDYDEVLYLTDTGRRWDGDRVSV
jgi:hypothetical protein